jgi:hypothetical protein
MLLRIALAATLGLLILTAIPIVHFVTVLGFIPWCLAMAFVIWLNVSQMNRSRAKSTEVLDRVDELLNRPTAAQDHG